MRDKIRPLRDSILVKAWKDNKTNWDMSEIAEAMNMNLKTVYRILKDKKRGGD